MLSWLFSDPLAVGEDAPDFTLGDQNGNALRARLNQFMKADVVPVAAN